VGAIKLHQHSLYSLYSLQYVYYIYIQHIEAISIYRDCITDIDRYYIERSLNIGFSGEIIFLIQFETLSSSSAYRTLITEIM